MQTQDKTASSIFCCSSYGRRLLKWRCTAALESRPVMQWAFHEQVSEFCHVKQLWVGSFLWHHSLSGHHLSPRTLLDLSHFLYPTSSHFILLCSEPLKTYIGSHLSPAPNLLLLLMQIDSQHGSPSLCASAPTYSKHPLASSYETNLPSSSSSDILSYSPFWGLCTCFPLSLNILLPIPKHTLPKVHLAHLDYPWDSHIKVTISVAPQYAGVSPLHFSKAPTAVLMILITAHNSILFSFV